MLRTYTASKFVRSTNCNKCAKVNYPWMLLVALVHLVFRTRSTFAKQILLSLNERLSYLFLCVAFIFLNTLLGVHISHSLCLEYLGRWTKTRRIRAERKQKLLLPLLKEWIKPYAINEDDLWRKTTSQPFWTPLKWPMR